MLVLKPIITEKTMGLVDRNTFTFGVERYARKDEIVKEIERQFEVHVIEIRTAVMHGKTKRVGKRRTASKMSDWKKAFVTLKQGEKIALFDIKA